MEGYSMFRNLKTLCKNFLQIDLERQCNPNQNPNSLCVCENCQANSKMYMKKNQDNLKKVQSWRTFCSIKVVSNKTEKGK